MTHGLETLYRALLAAWDNRDAEAFASLFASDGSIVGFDGSQVNGSENIQAHLQPIFRDHLTPTYVSIVQEVRTLSSEIVFLRAIAGLITPGTGEIDAALNAVQTLIGQRTDGGWRIALFQNTPAALHGRPGEVAAMTQELERSRAAR